MALFKSILSFFSKKKSIQKQVLPSPASYFDSSYYLATYADVAAAGVDPWHHFYHHGYAEGRWPAELQAVELEAMLWSEQTETQAEQRLLALTESEDTAESSAAAWFLGRWYAASQQWEQALAVMPSFTQAATPIPGHLAPQLLWLEVLRHQSAAQAQSYLFNLEKKYPHHLDVALMAMNLSVLPKSTPEWWQRLNTYYAKQGLVTIGLKQAEDYSLFDRLLGQGSVTPELPESSVLVTVIVPTYNAEKTIDTTLHGLVHQSWPHLEILIVDDASTDQTLAVVEKWVEKDSRIRVIKQAVNQGAYITRNLGLSQSQGEFITVHDSDDWSHPQKIEQQLQPLLKNEQLKATLSHWARVSDELLFGSWSGPEDWNGLVHRNVSSLLMRRQVFEQLGYWDNVVCSADTEYYYRIMTAYGGGAMQEVQFGVPLAFGRVRAESLTQRSETHIFSIFSGLRHDYREAYQKWHAHCSPTEQLYMSQHPDTRPFPVADKMLPFIQSIEKVEINVDS